MQQKKSLSEIKELVPADQLSLFALITLISSAINGGLSQYFLNCGHTLNEEIKKGLTLIGQSQKINLFERSVIQFNLNPHLEQDEILRQIESDFDLSGPYNDVMEFIKSNSDNFKNLLE